MKKSTVVVLASLFLFVTFLAGLFSFSATGLASAADPRSPTTPLVPINVFPNLSFEYPLAIVNGGDERLFIMEQAGQIWAVSGRGHNATKRLFLDFSEVLTDNGWETGPKALVFHPDFAQNGYFYVLFDTTVDEQLRTRISRFHVEQGRDQAQPESEVVLLETAPASDYHHGGDLHFDSTGMLIISLGDGGPLRDEKNRGQDLQSLLGKLLRIDVDRIEAGRNYAIPGDNPFLDHEARDEIWALGLRNPWRFSFDSQTGDLYLGDVGSGSWEEVDYVAAEELGGQNFGWSLKEGWQCFNPREDCDPGGLTDPVYVYGHDIGCAVVGGYVYRGELLSELQGVYVFADFCSGQISGLRRDPDGEWQASHLVKVEPPLSTFGQDHEGGLYFANRQKGTIYRLDTTRLLLPAVFQ